MTHIITKLGFLTHIITKLAVVTHNHKIGCCDTHNHKIVCCDTHNHKTSCCDTHNHKTSCCDTHNHEVSCYRIYSLFPTEHTNTELLAAKHIYKSAPLQSRQTCSGARSAYSLGISGLFLGVKRSDRQVEHSKLHLVPMLKIERSHSCTSPTCLHGVYEGLHHVFVVHKLYLIIYTHLRRSFTKFFRILIFHVRATCSAFPTAHIQQYLEEVTYYARLRF